MLEGRLAQDHAGQPTSSSRSLRAPDTARSAVIIRRMSLADQRTDSRDEAAFAASLDRHRRELQLHCYRMLGSLEDSEDVVQETFLRAWRRRSSFSDRGPGFASRLALPDRDQRLSGRAFAASRAGSWPPQVAAASDPDAPIPPRPIFRGYSRIPTAAGGDRPGRGRAGAVVVARETIEPAFVAAIQLPPPRQRAVLIPRDVLGWSAKDTASLLEASVAAVNSALQRARGTLRDHLGERRTDWAPATQPSEEERELRRYVEAHERADADALAELLHEKGYPTMPPHPAWYDGREMVMRSRRDRASIPPSVSCGRSSPGRTCSRLPLTTCERRVTPGTGHSRSTCSGSRAGRSRRSPRSYPPSSSRLRPPVAALRAMSFPRSFV